jgi:hypothetical protein
VNNKLGRTRKEEAIVETEALSRNMIEILKKMTRSSVRRVYGPRIRPATFRSQERSVGHSIATGTAEQIK